ncbi:MAG TPA: gluconate 2-dehydrogenase subunit 3 family protein [Terracidiphilus sp.]
MFSRREVLIGGAAAGAALISGCRSRSSRWEVLTDDEAQVLAILCDQVIPADDWPSASQAGVVVFIDRQLTGPYRRHKKAYREGLAQTSALSQSQFNSQPASVSQTQQLQLATTLQRDNPRFFELVRRHTLQGYYGSPRHGGNKDAVSWRMLGLDEPPLRGRAQYDLTTGPKS